VGGGDSKVFRMHTQSTTQRKGGCGSGARWRACMKASAMLYLSYLLSTGRVAWLCSQLLPMYGELTSRSYTGGRGGRQATRLQRSCVREFERWTVRLPLIAFCEETSHQLDVVEGELLKSSHVLSQLATDEVGANQETEVSGRQSRISSRGKTHSYDGKKANTTKRGTPKRTHTILNSLAHLLAHTLSSSSSSFLSPLSSLLLLSFSLFSLLSSLLLLLYFSLLSLSPLSPLSYTPTYVRLLVSDRERNTPSSSDSSLSKISRSEELPAESVSTSDSLSEGYMESRAESRAESRGRRHARTHTHIHTHTHTQCIRTRVPRSSYENQ
jgi:hypothetical protein